MPNPSGKDQPSFLFLQGLASPFMRLLADKLATKGATVHRVNYCGGDWWFGKGATKNIRHTNFLGKHSTLAATYQRLIEEYAITTVILFGDCRPIHKIAIKVAKTNDIDIVVFEEGYTRPGWITCEYGGTNDRSNLPRTAKAIRQRAREIGNIEQPTITLPNPMPPRVKMDLQFHASNISSFWYFHNYQTHRPEKVSAELKGWISRFWRKRKFGTENDALIKLYETTNERYFLVPLQLTSDFQIREHSDYDGVPDFIGEVIASFAAKAKPKDRLLIKSHPLDNGMIDYRSLIGTSTAVHGITDRVAYIEGGDLDILLSKAQGVVLINSTVGYAAIKAGKPMKVMGRALYDIEELTHQEPIDTFWKKPNKPDPELTADFLKVVRHDSQIYGDFFTDVGMELATDEASKRLMAGRP